MPSPGTPPTCVATARTARRPQRVGILTTVGLSVTENILRVAQPLVIGLAINDLHRDSFVGLLIVLAQQLMQILAGTGRRMAACRLAADLDPAPHIPAPAPPGLMRHRDSSYRQESATFFAETVPLTIRTALATCGPLLLLAWYDPTLAGMCALMMVPALLLGVSYSRRLAALNGSRRSTTAAGSLTADSDDEASRRFLGQIRHADAHAMHVGLIRLFALGALALVLVRASTDRLLQAGDLFTIVGSTLLFISGLSELPGLLQQCDRPLRRTR